MTKQVQISPIQLTILLMGFLFGTTVFIVSGFHAEQNAWIAFLLSWSGGILLFACYVLLSKKFPQKTLVEINKILLGNFLGSALSILYIWYFIHLGALILRNFGEYVVIAHMTETPLWFPIFLLLIISLYATKSGLEVTSRTAELVVPLIFLFQLILTLSLITEVDLSLLRPILQEGFPPVLRAAFSTLTFPFGETVVFLMIIPYLNKPTQLKKTYLSAFLIVGLILFITLIRDITILGPRGIERKIFAPHLVAKHVAFVDFDAVIGIMFFISSWTKLSVCYLGTTIGISQLTNSNNHRLFVYPVGIILMGLSIWIYDSASEMLSWAIDIWPLYSVPFQILFPLLLLLISFFKKDRTQNKESTYSD
ncbi:spore germination protein [Alkaliphilus metalliredigens QYMF]|uniref:Spore germination protein n=1 Tax=Alkaliphilus metalliredigens (strain QYMF) TaxID=293826 RepID=A6TMS0_ALKMQ|nr:endospore germination permease [Alkaliphilus metalliredigens]ABR47488.1 spore germination protein [Alkaliphilus metalliredigens QYMF]